MFLWVFHVEESSTQLRIAPGENEFAHTHFSTAPPSLQADTCCPAEQ